MTLTSPSTTTARPVPTATRLRRATLAIFGLFVLELVTGPSGVGEHPPRAVLAAKLVSLHRHYVAEGLSDLAIGVALVVLAVAVRRERTVGARLLLVGTALGTLMSVVAATMFLAVAHAGAAGYAAAYDAVPLRQTAMTLATLASAPLGLVLAGLALRLPRRRSGRRGVLATITLVVAAADVLSVVPVPGAGVLEVAFLPTIPLLGLVGWRLPRR